MVNTKIASPRFVAENGTFPHSNTKHQFLFINLFSIIGRLLVSSLTALLVPPGGKAPNFVCNPVNNHNTERKMTDQVTC